MTVTRLAARTAKGVAALSDAQLEALARQGGETRLVVPSAAWVQARKTRLMHAKLGGVRVLTHAQAVSELWDLYGNGSRLISPAQRALLARPLLAEALGAPPSLALLHSFCSFLEEAAVAPFPAEASLKKHERHLCELVVRYRETLQLKGLLEPAQAEEALVDCGADVGTLIVEEPNVSCAHAMRFYEEFGKNASVVLIGRSLSVSEQNESQARDELAGLASRLFAGRAGIGATGSVVAGEAYGFHVESRLAVELVRSFMERGAKPQDIAIVFRTNADSYPHTQDAFARTGIPFSCDFTLPFKSTPFGAAFLNLAMTSAQGDDDEGYKMVASLAASPYSGIEQRDARALQMRWRLRAKSTHEERMKDIREGFAQGNADQATLKERLSPLAQLFELDLASAAVRMFENAKARRGAFSSQLVDDERAADALLDYLEECASVECEPHLDDVSQLAVRLHRHCGAEGAGCVSFVDARSAALGSYPYVILASLDARHYPMARTPGPFDKLLEKMGLLTPDVQALRQRCLLLDALGAAECAFGFYRACHDKDGSETCQSALWDELMDVYGEPGEEGVSGREALDNAGVLLSLSEAEVFGMRDDGVPSSTVVRGQLAHPEVSDGLTQYPTGDAIPFSPTALEDYYRCPYRWFTSRRVGYNGMDNSFTASAQGNLAHSFFEKFYIELAKHGHRRVTPQNLQEALALAGNMFDKLLEKGLNKPRTGLFLKSELDRLNCEAVREQVLGLVERDAQFLPGFEPTYLELELGRGTGSTLMYAGVPVRGKVDRVDVDEKGRAVIIDYKLSSLSSGYGLRAGQTMPLRIQTDIYATLVQRHFSSLGLDLQVVGSVYRSYSTDALRGVYESGIDWGPLEHANAKLDALPSASCMMSYDEYLRMVESEVSKLLQNLSSGDIEPRPIAAGICDYCKALQFCPVGGR